MNATTTEAGPRRLLALTITVVATAAVVGILGAITGHDDAPRPGDLRLTARDFSFQPDAIETGAGDIAVFIDNADGTQHDFTIDGVVSVDVPGKRSRRATFALEPGLHSFWCTLHPAMTGTLTAR